MKTKVAVTYSSSVGGQSVVSLKESMKDLGSQVVDADYRAIVPLDEDIEKIYSSKVKLEKVYAQAKQNAEKFLQDKDCLMLSGNSAMVDPRLFGKAKGAEKTDLERSIAEMALIHVAMQKGMPVLGICGGHQIMNVYLGGTVKALDENALNQQGFMDYGEVGINPKSELGQMMKKQQEPTDKQVVERLFGAHRQVVEEVGGKGSIAKNKDLLKVVAKAKDNQKNIEAVESQYGAPAMGLQFHPEVAVKGLPEQGIIYRAKTEEEILKNRKIFEAFQKSAEAYSNKKFAMEQVKLLEKRETGNFKKSSDLSKEEILAQKTKIAIKMGLLEQGEPFRKLDKDQVSVVNQKFDTERELAQLKEANLVKGKVQEVNKKFESSPAAQKRLKDALTQLPEPSKKETIKKQSILSKLIATPVRKVVQIMAKRKSKKSAEAAHKSTAQSPKISHTDVFREVSVSDSVSKNTFNEALSTAVSNICKKSNSNTLNKENLFRTLNKEGIYTTGYEEQILDFIHKQKLPITSKAE